LSGGQSANQGHVITLEHDARFVPNRRVLPDVDLHGSLQVEFVGTRRQWDDLVGAVDSERRRRFFGMFAQTLQVRVSVVLRWLQVLRRVNPLYADVEMRNEGELHALEALPTGILDNVRISDNNVVVQVEAATSANVARPETEQRNHGVSGVSLGLRPAPRIPSATLVVNHMLARVNLELVNEYVHNDELLLGGFPHLFLFGQRIPTHGPLPNRFVSHLLLQHDQRFGRNNDLLFLLFNVTGARDRWPHMSKARRSPTLWVW